MISPGIDDFEKQRRLRETRNEVIINGILAACLAVPLVLHLLSYFRSDPTAFHPPLGLVILVCFGVLASTSFALYHRRNPPYRWHRKYVTTLTPILCNFLSIVFLRNEVPLGSLGFISIATHSLAIVLSGLRFDTRVVVVAGATTLCLQLIFLAFFVPAGSSVIPSLILAVILLGATTASVTYVVSSMIELHRESVHKEHLSRFLAPEVVEEISRKPQLLKQATETRTATILFADIRGFTTLSEKHPAAEIGRILNVVFEELTSAIMDNQGMVDKYIGDAVMGVFGVPVASENHALQAARAAIDMHRRLEALNQFLPREIGQPLAIGVGIHTGEVIAGAIGSSRRFEYTVIGDTVNVASRIESLTRKYSTGILLSAQTAQLIKEDLPLEEIATAQLKGRKQPVTLYSPVLPESGAESLPSLT
ncbi:MAG TPA: adenylate/guanylate cyclase domain-containing protein [Myxococcota bacterium]|nr:adenylate/guanylate cyclase domain-containing protein [Myxococcota bacterium]